MFWAMLLTFLMGFTSYFGVTAVSSLIKNRRAARNNPVVDSVDNEEEETREQTQELERDRERTRSNVEEQAVERSATGRPSMEKSTAEKPVAEKPATQTTVTDTPVTQTPVADMPAAETPAAETSVTEAPAVEGAKTEDKAVEKRIIDENENNTSQTVPEASQEEDIMTKEQALNILKDRLEKNKKDNIDENIDKFIAKEASAIGIVTFHDGKITGKYKSVHDTIRGLWDKHYARNEKKINQAIAELEKTTDYKSVIATINEKTVKGAEEYFNYCRGTMKVLSNKYDVYIGFMKKIRDELKLKTDDNLSSGEIDATKKNIKDIVNRITKKSRIISGNVTEFKKTVESEYKLIADNVAKIEEHLAVVTDLKQVIESTKLLEETKATEVNEKDFLEDLTKLSTAVSKTIGVKEEDIKTLSNRIEIMEKNGYMGITEDIDRQISALKESVNSMINDKVNEIVKTNVNKETLRSSLEKIYSLTTKLEKEITVVDLVAINKKVDEMIGEASKKVDEEVNEKNVNKIGDKIGEIKKFIGSLISKKRGEQIKIKFEEFDDTEKEKIVTQVFKKIKGKEDLSVEEFTKICEKLKVIKSNKVSKK